MAKKIIRREPIDFNLALKGSDEIHVWGRADNDLRQELIRKAIGISQKDPEWESMDGGDGKRYLGVHVFENYPEQSIERTDYSPLPYGKIVFRIEWKKKVTAAGIYYLELFLLNKEIDVSTPFEVYKTLKGQLVEVEKEFKNIEYEKEYWR